MKSVVRSFTTVNVSFESARGRRMLFVIDPSFMKTGVIYVQFLSIGHD